MINWEQLKEDTLKIQIEDTYPVKWKRKHSTTSSLSSDFYQTGLPGCSDGLWQIQLPCTGWVKAIQKSNQWNKDFLVTVIIQTNQGITIPYRSVEDLTRKSDLCIPHVVSTTNQIPSFQAENFLLLKKSTYFQVLRLAVLSKRELTVNSIQTINRKMSTKSLW